MNIKLKPNFNTAFGSYDDNDNSYRDANNVLYDMVRKNPFHNNEDWIVAKFWVIGRTYAAAVERCKHTNSGDFYYNSIVPLFRKNNLDQKITNITSRYKEISLDALKEVLALHKELVDLIKQATKKENISFVSKYLHFHMPELVFIYDSRAHSAIDKFVDSNIRKSDFSGINCNNEYAKFAFKAFEIYNKLKSMNYSSQHGDTLPRIVDNFLLRN